VGGLGEAAHDTGVPVQLERAGSMFGLFFADAPVRSWDDAKRANTDRFASFQRALLERGVYLAPSQFEAGFVSTAHGEDEIDATIAAAREAFATPA
jgi:glutamate-1-semialdehyde 2,1-aminomutase